MGNPVPTAAARAAKGKPPSYKRHIRMIRAVRLEAALYKDAEIALFLDITPAGLAQLKMDPEYDKLRMQQMTGVITEAEREFLDDIQYKHERLREMLPQALQVLYDRARSQNENISLKAATEILDREGTLAKVSRIGLATEEQGGVGTAADDEIAANLLNIHQIQLERANNESKKADKTDSKGSTTIQ